jgi:hypothetical protein
LSLPGHLFCPFFRRWFGDGKVLPASPLVAPILVYETLLRNSLEAQFMIPGNKLAITTTSLGLLAFHSLPKKIEAATSHGFTSLEFVYQEIVDYELSQSPLLRTCDAASSRRTFRRL